jgi:geranylgeranyl pyrophosphate synthase
VSAFTFDELISAELARVEDVLRERMVDQHPIIGSALERLIDGGGKRVRPALVLLSAHLCGGGDIEPVVQAAAAVEMLHTATLIHDDLIDGARVRRGVETLNVDWSPGATVLVGDFAFARAAYLASRTGNQQVVRRFAETLMVICNGEVRQMFDGRSDGLGREGYQRRIYAKTASLIALSTEMGALLVEADPQRVGALYTYGEQLGLAFQVVDDVLDFVADEETLGKPVGSDLRQGLVTLPLLLFLEAHEDPAPSVARALGGDLSDGVVREAVRQVVESGAIERALDVARAHAERAKQSLTSFPASPYRAALVGLADFTVRRRF